VAVSTPSGTVTFLFTDIEGSTRLWQADETAMRAALSRHDELLRKTVAEHEGMVFSSTGDGMAAVFQSASLAMGAALTSQRLLDAEGWPTAAPISVRMGLHTGEAEARDGDYFGTAVNRTARLMAIGHGGQVLCSSATAEILGDAVVLVDLGEHRLRDLDRPMHVFQIGSGGFGPLRSLESFLGNLPLQVTSFVGRERELAQGVEVLGKSRVVTLTGVGGVGKTRLALQLAAEVLPRFRDGAWLVELAALRDPDRVADVVAAVFGVSARGDETVGDAVIEVLRSKQMLLLLDNCEHLLDPVAALVDRVERSCAGVVVLATSREGLALDGEQILAVPSLAVPDRDTDIQLVARSDAVILFVERARHVDADFALAVDNSAAVARVCHRLDGVPLAIELAAARVNAMTPSELARGLDHRFETLAGGRRVPVQRHQTLRAAIDWSYDLLTEAERRLLARLSVFSGGCTRGSAEEVCSGDPLDAPRVFSLLTGLVARSLVVADRRGPDTRYRLLETIREYGEERLAQRGESKVVRRDHAYHYAQLSQVLYEQARGVQQPEALRALAAENENLLAAMAYAIDMADVDLALRLLTASTGQALWYNVPPVRVDALLLDGAVEHPLYPRALAKAAVYAAERGDVPSAEQLADAALASAAKLPTIDPLAEYEAHIARARAANSVGAILAEAAHYERAANVARSAGLLYETTFPLGCAAFQIAMSGDADRALPLATEALATSRQVGAPGSIALNLMALAAVLARRNSEEANSLLHEGTRTAALVGEMSNVLSALTVLVAAYMGDWDQVSRSAPKALRGFLWTGQRSSLTGILNLVARALAPVDPNTAAMIQGAVRRLAVTRPQSVQIHPQGLIGDQKPTPGGGTVAELRRETTSILRETLGEPHLRELRSLGEATDDDHIVALTLDAIARAQAAATQ
jgi:predicted ATPase/class 3 adenylate cyclase